MIVTMLSFVGAWGQDGTPLNIEVGSTTYIYGYQFNQGGTYGPSVIQWTKEDKAGTTTTLVSVTCDDPAVTATLSDGTTSITVNSACSNVPVIFNFKKIETIWVEGVSHDQDYDEGVATFLITANANTCTWTIDQTPITIDVSVTQDRDFTFNTVWERNDGSSTIQSVVSNNTSVATITNFNNGKSFSIHPVAKGQAEITITASCSSQTDTKTLIVNVTDNSLAEAIIVDAEVTDGIYTTNVTKGLTSQVTVRTTPEDAVKSLKDLVKKSGNDNITVQSFDKNSGVITFAATYAEIGDEATFTIYGKENSTAEDVDIKVTVIAPKAADGITLKVNGVTIDNATTQNLVKSGTFTIVPQVTPADAADKSFSWNDYDASIISIEGNVVTALKHGTTTLQATSTAGSFTTPVVTINVTEAFEGTINVPASTRVGVNSSSASVNITNGAVAEDYVVTYSSDHPEILDVNSSTGALTPKAEGTAKITAMIEASTAGQAKGFTNSTIVSGDISVGAEITGSFETFSMADMALGDQTEYAVAALPTVTWTPALTDAHPYAYVTEWEIVDESGCLTSLWSSNDKKLFVAATKTGTTTAKIIAKYVQNDWTTGSAVPSVMATAEQEFNVTVSGVTGTITLDPAGDITFDKKEGNQTVNATVNWSDGTTGSAVSVVSNNEYANTTPSGLTITIQPVKKGSETVTVNAAWKKELNWPFQGTDAIAEATPVTFTVNVLDETKADVLTFEDGTTSKTVNVAKGYKADVKVKVEPAATAQLHLDKTSEGGVTAEYNAETSTITLTAAAEATGATFTFTDDVKSISVTANIVDPVSVSSIALDAATYTVAKDKTTKATATVLPVDASDLAVVWSSGNEEVFKVVDGVITGVARGTATLTAKSRMNESILATATVNVTEELPVTGEQPKSTFGVGETYTSQLTIAGMTKGTDYDVTYESDNTGVLSVTNDGELTAIAKGTANITVTFEPKNTETAKNYTTWTRTMKVAVKEAIYGISIAATPTTLNVGTAGTVTISSENVTLNNAATTKVKNTDYTVVYSLENASDDISINEATGAVSVPTTAPVQQFTIVATLEPVEAQKNDYKGAVGKAAVLVENASAQVTISVDADGVYTVNVPSPGAFGGLSEAPTVVLGTGASLDGLYTATSVKVTGLLANSDVKELVNLLARKDGSNKLTTNCEILDMGGAQMTEAVTKTDNGAQPKCDWLDIDNGKSLFKVQNLTLPRPAVGVTGGTILPANTLTLVTNWYTLSTNELTSLTIPEGWTETESGFSGYHGGTETTLQKLTSLSLPNTLENIGAYSFSDLRVKVLYMPNKLQRIDQYAFSPCRNLQDVYFTGPAPSFVHKDAFAGETQMCNNTVDDNQLQGVLDPVITRYEYHKLDVYACILHYPNEYEEDYIDTSRKYKVIPVDQPYSKGNSTGGNTYDLPGWTADRISAINPTSDEDAATLATLQQDYGVKDKTYGYDFIWPSQSQMATGYLIARAGYKWTGEALDTGNQYDPSATYENGGVDKRGLYEFIVGMGNAPKNQEEWPFKFQQDLWYTIALPFDMSIESIKRVFGENTQVCRFSKVVRDVSDPKDKVLRLEFRNSVLQEEDNRDKNITYTENVLNPDGTTTSTTFDQEGIRHHHPYMIKPSGYVNDTDPSIKFNASTGERVYSGFQSVSGVLQEDKVTAVLKDRETIASGNMDYHFRPILMKGTLKKNSYVLTKKSETVHQFYFYKGHMGEHGYEDGGTATANTAYVQLDHGMEDFNDFFSDTPVQATSKVRFASFFGDFIDEDEATKIDRIEIVCGDDEIGNDKIYTISGVQVSGNSLTPGLYIKNGKKFIVK